MTVFEGTVLITESEVRSSIRRVIDHAESIWDEWAWQVENKTWSVLGHADWDTMRRVEYGNLNRISAPRAETPELVARFRDAGLTQRETADTLGIGERTVKRHDEPTYAPRESKVPNGTFVNTETGEVSDDYVTDQADLDAPFVDASDDQIEQAFAAAREQSDVSHRNVVGNLPEGKAYTRPEPTKPRRTPLPDSIRNAVLGAETKLTTLRDLTRDDRWPRNAEEVAPRLRNDLMRLKDLLAQVEKSLPENEVTA